MYRRAPGSISPQNDATLSRSQTLTRDINLLPWSPMRKILAIARFTFLDAVRSRLLLVAVVLMIVLSASSALLNELAITDSVRIQVGVLAPALRFSLAFLIAAFVISTLQREFNEQGAALVLAQDLPRGHYVLGKTLGFTLLAWCIALLFSLPLFWLTAIAQYLAWTASLFMEAAIVSTFAVFCAISLRNMTSALVLTLGFYLLAKTIAVLQLMSHASLAATSGVHRYMNGALDIVALLLPRLDKFAQTGWLVDGFAGFSVVGALLPQTLIYIALIAVAAIIDMQRKNF